MTSGMVFVTPTTLDVVATPFTAGANVSIAPASNGFSFTNTSPAPQSAIDKVQVDKNAGTQKYANVTYNGLWQGYSQYWITSYTPTSASSTVVVDASMVMLAQQKQGLCIALFMDVTQTNPTYVWADIPTEVQPATLPDGTYVLAVPVGGLAVVPVSGATSLTFNYHLYMMPGATVSANQFVGFGTNWFFNYTSGSQPIMIEIS